MDRWKSERWLGPTILALNSSSWMKIIANARRGSFVTQQRYQDMRLSFFQAAILLILMISGLAKLLFIEVPRGKVPVGVFLSPAALSFILPSPHLWTKLSSQTNGYFCLPWVLEAQVRHDLYLSCWFHVQLSTPSFKNTTTFRKIISHCWRNWLENWT